jgi:hypothetical protein
VARECLAIGSLNMDDDTSELQKLSLNLWTLSFASHGQIEARGTRFHNDTCVFGHAYS